MMNTLLQKNWPWLTAAGLVALWLLSTAIKYDPPIEDPRVLGGAADISRLAEREDLNVIFIVIDTLRAERLSAYGYDRNTSPTIDRFASNGVRFDRHLAQSSWTKASMASLWTSLYPMRTGVTRFEDMVSADAVMAAERMKEAGFRTVGLYRNGWLAPTFGFEQGFDVYTHTPRRRFNPKVRAQNPTLSKAGTDEDTIAAAIEFLRVSSRDSRWFLYLHMMDVHEFLYDEESALFGGEHSDMYDNSIRWTDGSLDILFSYLAEFGLAQNTLVVITSDHGEAFRERGLEGHARAVYRETTEIPFLIFFPFRLEPGLVIPTRTQGVDVWPTLFDLIGLDPPEESDGRSRVPEIMAAASGQSRSDLELDDTTIGISVLDETWGRRDDPILRIAVTEGTFRYVRRNPTPISGRTEPTEELFDAATDPAELKNVISKHPELVDRLRAIADTELEATPSWGEAPTRDLNELELNQLRALGYALP